MQRNPEQKRARYLVGGELQRLTEALAQHEDRQAADTTRPLLLTGARRGEAMSARWADFDLEAGIWTKPGRHDKAEDRASHPAVGAGAPDPRRAARGCAEGCRVRLPRPRQRSSGRDKGQLAGHLQGRENQQRARSRLASHRRQHLRQRRFVPADHRPAQAATTHRYAHLFDDPLKAATERVGAIVTGGKSAVVVPLKGTGNG